MAAGNSISTHAPAGGATDYWNMARRDGLISTHAPAGGATWGAPVLCRQDLISTHAPAGGATRIASRVQIRKEISTHAPAGGATLSGLLRRPFSTHFYSRPCGRGDQYRRSRQPARCSYFYSRPCGRGDRRKPAAARPLPYFYSRPCGRGDSFVMEIMAFSTLFLLTPLREGRRLPGQRGLMACGISTHAPAGGATSRLACLFVRAIDFYSRPCGRGDSSRL